MKNKCSLCGREFVRTSNRQQRCLDCKPIHKRVYRREYRQIHLEEETESQKKYHQKKKFKRQLSWRKWYSKNKDSRNAKRRELYKERRRIQARNYANKYPHKVLAQRACKSLAMKTNCEDCGSTLNLQRHHPDYSKPLEFLTLCRDCHAKKHNPIPVIGWRVI